MITYSQKLMVCVTLLYNYALLQPFNFIMTTLHDVSGITDVHVAMTNCFYFYAHTFSCVWNSLDVINDRSHTSGNVDTCICFGTTVESYHNPLIVKLPQYWATRRSRICSGHMPYVRACSRGCVHNTILRLQICGASVMIYMHGAEWHNL